MYKLKPIPERSSPPHTCTEMVQFYLPKVLCVRSASTNRAVARRLGNQMSICADNDSVFSPSIAMNELPTSLFPFPHMNYKMLLKCCIKC